MKELSIATDDVKTEAISNSAEKKKKTGDDRGAKTEKLSETKKTYMYLGPTLRASNLQENMVFILRPADLNEYFKEELLRFPECKRLIVPTGDVVNIRRMLKTEGSAVNRAYEVLSKEANE